MTIEEIGKYSKRHLCNDCDQEFAECQPKEVLFGDGFGNDNVCYCSERWVEQTNE